MTFKFWDCIAVLIARGLAQKKAQKKYILCTIVMGSHLIALVHNLH